MSIDHKAAAEFTQRRAITEPVQKLCDAYLDLRRLVKEYFDAMDEDYEKEFAGDGVEALCLRFEKHNAARAALRAAIEQGEWIMSYQVTPEQEQKWREECELWLDSPDSDPEWAHWTNREQLDHVPSAISGFLAARAMDKHRIAKLDAIEKNLDFEPCMEYNIPDMANIGHALMETLSLNLPDYHPSNCPSEIVTDLLNDICDLKKEHAQRIAELEAQAEISKQLLTRASNSIGDFVSDHGWTDSDMDIMDSIDAFLAADKRTGE